MKIHEFQRNEQARRQLKAIYISTIDLDLVRSNKLLLTDQPTNQQGEGVVWWLITSSCTNESGVQFPIPAASCMCKMFSQSMLALAGFLRDNRFYLPLKLGRCIVCYVAVGTPLKISLTTWCRPK